MIGSKLVTATEIQRMLIFVERGTMKKDRGIDQEIIVIVMIEKETHAMVMIDKDMLVIVIGILAKFTENVRESEVSPRPWDRRASVDEPVRHRISKVLRRYRS